MDMYTNPYNKSNLPINTGKSSEESGLSSDKASGRNSGNDDIGINTTLSDYTIDDLFSLLDIEITEEDTYNSVKGKIIKSTDKHIAIFQGMNNAKLVDFFKNVRDKLLGSDNYEEDAENKEENSFINENERLLIVTNNSYDAETNRGFKTNSTDTTDKALFDSKSGAGNPINRKTVTKLLNIDSRFRSNYTTTTSTDYTIELPYPINNVIEMKLSDLEFPSTYYPFNDDNENNYFWIKFAQGNGAQIYLYIYIAPGNYYHTSLIKAIQDAFDEFGVDLAASFNLTYENTGGIGVGDGHVTIGLSVGDNITNITEVELNFKGKMLPTDIYAKSTKFLIEDSEDIINDYYYQESLVDYKQRFGWMMGFRKGTYTGSSSYISEGILDILGPKYLYLILDDQNMSSNVNFFNSSEETMLDRNILARISIKGYAFSIQSQTDLSIYSEPRYYYGPININKLRVKVVDEYGRLVNLNGMDFSFTLGLITIYSQG